MTTFINRAEARATATGQAASSSAGIGLFGGMTLLLMAAKMFAPQWADLSWWIVFAPVLALPVTILGFCLVIGLAVLLILAWEKFLGWLDRLFDR